MKRSNYLLSGLVLGALVAGLFIWNMSAGAASAQTTKIDAGLVAEYDARAEFSLVQGGTSGVWSYGSTSGSASDAFLPYGSNSTPDGCGSPAGVWFQTALGNNPPVIAAFQAPNGCAGVRPDSLFFHPGPGGERAVLRWTAPAAGTYQINGAFQRADPAATSDLRIVKNQATVVMSGDVLSKWQLPIAATVTVAAGDTIDFSVGYGNGVFFNDGSALSVTVAPPPTSCLTAPANLQVSVPAENSPTDVASVNPNASLVGDATYTNSGKAGRAFDLDGSGDYVRIEDNPAQRPATAVTAEGWFKFDNASGVVSLISKPLRNSGLNSYTLYLDGGQLRGLVSNGPQYTRVFSSFTPQAGVWNHLAFTYDLTGGVSTLRLYANGADVTTGQDGTPNIQPAYDANPYPLLIGGEFESNTPAFFLDGQADEISVYGRALAQGEIFDIVQRGSFGKCGPAPCAQALSNLVSWYAGEGSAVDSKSGNHGTLQNGATFAAGKVGSGIKFDGVDDRVEIADTPSLKPQNITVETWVKFDSLASNTLGGAPSGYQILVFKKNQSVGNYEGYGLVKNPNNTLSVVIAPGNGNIGVVLSSATVATTGAFYHVVGTYDGATVKLYVNGQLEATTAYNLPLNYDTRPVFLGTSGESFFDGKFNGILDETSIYNGALTASEVLSIYNAGASGKCKPIASAPAPNQIAWFTGDGDTRDFTGLNPNGIRRGDAAFAAGQVGQSFSLDGSGDYVELPDDADQRPSTQLTAEGWFRFNNFNNLPHLIGKGLRGTDLDSYVMWFGNGNIRIGYADSASNMFVYDTGFAPFAGETYHYAIVLNTDDAGADANTFKLYVNGAQVFSGAAGGPIFYDANPHPLTIGADINNDVPDFPLNGQADEVSLYGRALTASEIAAIYNAGRAGKSKSKVVAATVAPFDGGRNRKGRLTADGAPRLAPATVQLATATVAFANVTSSGTITESGADLAFLPALPANVTSAGLAFEIATTAAYQTGSPDDVQVCFNLPALASADFARLRILHLEGGAWVNRTAAVNAAPSLCTDNLTSLSPFAIVQTLAPTAANDIVVSGRVATPEGGGIANVAVTLTDTLGRTRVVRSNSFGRYAFDQLAAGEVYFVSVAAKRFAFDVGVRAVNAPASVDDVDFVGTPLSR